MWSKAKHVTKKMFLKFYNNIPNQVLCKRTIQRFNEKLWMASFARLKEKELYNVKW
jgi:hypothetical protein